MLTGADREPIVGGVMQKSFHVLLVSLFLVWVRTQGLVWRRQEDVHVYQSLLRYIPEEQRNSR